MTPVALSVAGSDPSGGAGIQADLKTFHQHGVYGCAVVTVVTAQSTVEVRRAETLAADLVESQLTTLLQDITPAAIKTGALGSAAVVEVVAGVLSGLPGPLVVDPVMISKHGRALLNGSGVLALRRTLLPQCALITPNLEEVAQLSGRSVETRSARLDAARALLDLGAGGVLLKGGHLPGPPVDVLVQPGAILEIPGTRVTTRHTHGVGCTLSAAITARLCQGHSLPDACAGAKGWLERALARAPGVGAGTGAVDHGTPVQDPPEGAQ